MSSLALEMVGDALSLPPNVERLALRCKISEVDWSSEGSTVQT